MKNKFLVSVVLLMALFTLSSFTDGPDYTNTYMNGHEYVDLGLPSGTKWATCNVGASKPEEFGDDYAWGEISKKEIGTWETYKWCNGDEYSLTKYCTDSYYGRIDNRTQLAPTDDVAHVKWGGAWRMPTIEEIKELLKECTWQLTSRRGINGYRVIGPNGNSIFLPSVEFRFTYDEPEAFVHVYGDYWSSSLYSGDNGKAFVLETDEVSYGCDSGSRCNVCSVRPVFKPVKKNTSSAKNSNTINGHEYVDLGLPSGLKWATCNVGANNPWEDGCYYAWGETVEKENYDWSTYKWCKGSYDTMTKYCTDSDYGRVDNKTVLEPQDDVAHVKWGSTWRMPTIDEQRELLNECSWEWIELNGVPGYSVTGPNGNSIFLPAAGSRGGTEVDFRGNYGEYLSSSLYSNGSSYARHLRFRSGDDWALTSRCLGLSVRPVSK